MAAEYRDAQVVHVKLAVNVKRQPRLVFPLLPANLVPLLHLLQREAEVHQAGVGVVSVRCAHFCVPSVAC